MAPPVVGDVVGPEEPGVVAGADVAGTEDGDDEVAGADDGELGDTDGDDDGDDDAGDEGLAVEPCAGPSRSGVWPW